MKNIVSSIGVIFEMQLTNHSVADLIIQIHCERRETGEKPGKERNRGRREGGGLGWREENPLSVTVSRKPPPERGADTSLF